MTETVDAPAATKPRRKLGLVVVPAIVFALMALMFAFALKTGDPSRLPSALIGKPAPKVALEALDGLVVGGKPVPPFSTAVLGNGKPAVVNFWASWCVPCVQEHPFLIEIAARTGLAVHGINYKDQTAAARRFLGLHGNPFTTVGVDGSGRAAIEWGVYGMPETFVVDGQGTVVYKHVGPISRESLDTRVFPALIKAGAQIKP